MLDRANTRPHCCLDALGSLGVGHYRQIRGRRFGDQHGQLVVAEMGMSGFVSG